MPRLDLLVAILAEGCLSRLAKGKQPEHMVCLRVDGQLVTSRHCCMTAANAQL